MVTLLYVLAVAGGLFGIAMGWKVSHRFNPNRNKFASPTFDAFMKRAGVAVSAGAVPFIAILILANYEAKQQEIENAKRVEETISKALQPINDIYSQGLGAGVNQDSINANGRMNRVIQNSYSQ